MRRDLRRCRWFGVISLVVNFLMVVLEGKWVDVCTNCTYGLYALDSRDDDDAYSLNSSNLHQALIYYNNDPICTHPSADTIMHSSHPPTRAHYSPPSLVLDNH